MFPSHPHAFLLAQAVDLGQGVSDYIESRGLPEKATAQYIKEVDWLCQVSPRMNEQVWDRVRYIMVWSGIADPI